MQNSGGTYWTPVSLDLGKTLRLWFNYTGKPMLISDPPQGKRVSGYKLVSGKQSSASEAYNLGYRGCV